MSAFDLQVLSLHVDNHLGRTVDCHDGQLKEVSSHIELISFNERRHFGQHFLVLKSQHLNEIAIESGVFSLDYLLSQTSPAHYLEQNKGYLLHS